MDEASSPPPLNHEPAESEQLLLLIEIAVNGDEDAFRSIVEPRQRLLRHECRKVLRNDHEVEDAANRASLEIWRSLKSFSGSTTREFDS